MTQHISPPSDPQRLAHPSGDPSASGEHNAPRGFSGWWFGLLALLPIACCTLPLLVIGGVAAGSGVALGGVIGGVLLLAGAVVLSISAVRRRSRARGAHRSSTDPR